ncbi:diacylglycerol/lipid kinase family protein [Actinobaculum suis]|uniref:diacylglycerol/lipid kinase family protein n=1 Tax=Actinobaculum suis TaxID=1657 RepID=UPI0008086B69|nr:diacylglycerol kinase family protein [Actinobaculum suis]OCA95662.1 hypothetical protein ACU20_00375 [Actinobaculum suis]OCA95863.1 hypothetical protein ACU21_00370 [Actinobaculum suis]
MKIKNVTLLYRPAAVRRYASKLRKFVRELEKLGVTVHQTMTGNSQVTQMVVRERLRTRDTDALIIFGGDGFLHAVLQETAGTDMPLGIIPAGSGNDFARHLRISKDPRRAAAVIAAGNAQPLDLGYVEPLPAGTRTGQWFATIACIGFDSRIVARTNSFSWPRGTLRYVISLLVELPNYGAVPAQIYADGELVHDERMTLCAVSNTRFYGGGFPIGVGAQPDDGVLNTTVVGGIGKIRLGANIPRLFTGGFTKVPEVKVIRGQEIIVAGARGLTCHADGEAVCPAPFRVRIVPGAMRFLVP